MALSPLDIHNKEFSRSMFRGYDEDEVNEFLEQVLKDYENVLEEKKTLENSLKQSNRASVIILIQLKRHSKSRFSRRKKLQKTFVAIQ